MEKIFYLRSVSEKFVNTAIINAFKLVRDANLI